MFGEVYDVKYVGIIRRYLWANLGSPGQPAQSISRLCSPLLYLQKVGWSTSCSHQRAGLTGGFHQQEHFKWKDIGKGGLCLFVFIKYSVQQEYNTVRSRGYTPVILGLQDEIREPGGQGHLRLNSKIESAWNLQGLVS